MQYRCGVVATYVVAHRCARCAGSIGNHDTLQSPPAPCSTFARKCKMCIFRRSKGWFRAGCLLFRCSREARDQTHSRLKCNIVITRHSFLRWYNHKQTRNMAPYTRCLVFVALLLAAGAHARKNKISAKGGDDLMCFVASANAGKEVPPLPKSVKATGEFAMYAVTFPKP